MKNLKNILLLLMLPIFSFSQQMPHYSLYMMNDVVINPSLISTKSENQVALMIRDQWTGFEGSPKTQSISYYNINHRKYGRGLSVVNDNTIRVIGWYDNESRYSNRIIDLITKISSF